jgi:MFS family permease
MLKRFSLYGFLKNQQYHEPFLLLALRQMGLSFFQIGLLVAVREIVVNLMEIPSGAIADLAGRRRSMILSFVSYILSFTLMGVIGIQMAADTASSAAGISTMALLGIAFAFHGIGDAFRTGTHKALIFSWLRAEGRLDERTQIYGYTRSWSKIGSAISVILAAGFVFLTDNYIFIFFFSTVPYLLNIINFLGYPDAIDPRRDSRPSHKTVHALMWNTVRLSIRKPPLRRLIIESMGYEGYFKAVKDYLQPILSGVAILYFATHLQHWNLTEQQQTSLVIGPIFFILFLLSAFASRNAFRLVKRQGNEESTARLLWIVFAMAMFILTLSIYFEALVLTVICFISLYCLQNLWRPVLISRFDAFADDQRGATVLSIESQAKSIATMIISPILGYSIDWAKSQTAPESYGREFWPIGVIGFCLALFFLIAPASRLTHHGHPAGKGRH